MASEPSQPHCDTCAGKPGSDDAIADGCRCPVMDNGRGHNEFRMVFAGNCPVHGVTVEASRGD